MVIGDAIRRNAKNYSHETAIIFGDERFTWRELNDRVNGLANGLLDLGLKKQDKVAVLSRSSYQYIETYLALAKAGLICVPLSTWEHPKEMHYILDNSEVDTLIIDRDYKEIFNSFHSKLKGVNNLIGIGKDHGYPYDFETLIDEHPTDEPRLKVDEDDVFLIAYTGGTTGRPKGVVFSHKNHCIAAMNNIIEFRVLPDSIWLCCTPLFFIGGWMGAAFTAFMRGCPLVWVDFVPQVVLETIEKERITHVALVPTMINMLVNHLNVYKYDYSSLRLILAVGMAMPATLLRKAMEVFGPVFAITYGATEICTMGTILQKEDIILEGSSEKVKRMGSVGKASISFDVRVVNENDGDVTPGSGEVGELILRGDQVTKEYWKLPEETAKSIKNGWWYSGDLATVDEDGYIYIVDRKKDMIISGGANIYPHEIEEVIYTHPSVLHASVIGVPDEKWGESLKAVIVLKEGKKVSEEEIINLCKENLASYKKPKSVEFIDTIPLSFGGKILKRELRQRYWKGYERKS